MSSFIGRVLYPLFNHTLWEKLGPVTFSFWWLVISFLMEVSRLPFRFTFTVLLGDTCFPVAIISRKVVQSLNHIGTCLLTSLCNFSRKKGTTCHDTFYIVPCYVKVSYRIHPTKLDSRDIVGFCRFLLGTYKVLNDN